MACLSFLSTGDHKCQEGVPASSKPARLGDLMKGSLFPWKEEWKYEQVINITFTLIWHLTWSSSPMSAILDYSSLLFNAQNWLHDLSRTMLCTKVTSSSIISIIIIIGSTALRGPWSSSEASASWSIRLLLFQISWQESFPGWGCQPHAQPPAILEGRCFLSGLSPLAN
jgi:hypothetical protein